jgi:hypothetical protein
VTENNRRSNLTRPPVPTAAREGLSLRALSDEELNDKLAHHASWDPAWDEKWWTVEFTKKQYKSVTLAFMKTVYSGGPRLPLALISS